MGRTARGTALERYARLEAEARYFDGESAQPLPVMVSFGERSLVIMGFDGVALAHWPLASLRAVGHAGDRAAQLTPDPASEERLVLEDQTMVRAIESVCPALHRRKADRRGIRVALAWGGLAVGAVLVMVFVIVPRLAEPLAELIPPEREAALGRAVVGQIQTVLGQVGDQAPGFCAEEDGQAALAAMKGRLEAETALPYPLSVTVLDHPLVNAFAAPGGQVVLFRGLIDAAESPEEVAGVLAHEIGHVVYRDPTVGVLRSAGRAGILGLLFGDVFGVAIVVVASEAVLNARHQREVEARADTEAHEILARAGLPSTPFGRFFERMIEEHGDASGILRYLSSHPELAGRAQKAIAADRLGSRAFEPVLDDRQWLALRQICTETAGSLDQLTR